MTLKRIGILSTILWCAAGVTRAEERGDRAFQQLDADGDGQISREEFKQEAPRMLAEMKQERERRAQPEEKRPPGDAPEAKEKDIEKQIDRVIEKKMAEMRKDRPGPGPGMMAGPKGPAADRDPKADFDAPRRRPGPPDGPADRGPRGDQRPGRGMRDGERGPMSQGPGGVHGFAKGMERGKGWDGPQRGAGGPGRGGRGPGPQGSAAMLDANRDGRIDGVELDRLIDKLQAIRARIGDEGISLEAFRSHMMTGQGWAAPQEKPVWEGKKRGPVGDKQKAVKGKPDRPRQRDGEKEKQRGQDQ